MGRIEREWVENEIGDYVLAGCDDEIFKHYYHAMHDHDMSFYEADAYAWLITLFGYDIGADTAIKIINWYWENDSDALEICVDDKEHLAEIAENIGCNLIFDYMPDTTPNYISFDHVDCIEWIE